MNRQEFVEAANAWGHERVPFLFIVDFEFVKPLTFRLDEISASEFLFDINGFSNSRSSSKLSTDVSLSVSQISLDMYKEKFDKVMDRLCYGDSFLTNLTIKTPVEFNLTLPELFYASQAKYKAWLKDQFLVFSPEIFVQIENGVIRSFPMKGTIDAGIMNAQEAILNDSKELAEHITIVDLIRNDLSKVATNVTVSRFRYLDEIVTNSKRLYQVSSEIRGDLPSDYRSRLGDIISELLPAGSVSGAPKEKTISIIRDTEHEIRGYYTGILGYFDGNNLDSGVMIRFIEQNGNDFYYRSGGGITTQSKVEQEYKEAIDKIYVPVV